MLKLQQSSGQCDMLRIIPEAPTCVKRIGMEGTGRRWSIAGAESTLLLRSIYTSSDWDAYWENHRQQEQKHLYSKILLLFACADDFSERKAA